MSASPLRHLHLIAPSGYCQNQSAAWRGVDWFIRQGCRVTGQAVIARRDQRFAGNDSERLHDWQQLLDMAELPDIILAVRGGYGATRLLPHLDYRKLTGKFCHQPLAICGHSDFTAIQMALLARSGIISFSAPMLTGNFGAEQVSEFTLHHFWHALTSPVFTIDWQTSPRQLAVSGILWGGNLSMLASLVGTPWLPTVEGGILVIEDVNEHPFRIERMLLQLAYSGVLARQQAIIAGSFTGSILSEYDHGYDFAVVWTQTEKITGLPVVTGLSFGHDCDTVTVPLGAAAHLQVEGNNASLTLSGHPTLR